MSIRAKAGAAVLAATLAAGLQPDLAVASGPVMLVEAESGRVLFAEDQDDQWYPASLTKIMTAYLTFEAIKAGRLQLTDTVVVSDKAHVQPPSKLGLPVGAELGVELAIRTLIVKSANDVAMMLAEKIAGSEDDFVKLMNDTAKRLGMTRTHFVNPNGLPAPGQVSTARDLARLSRAILADFPDKKDLWTLSEVRVGKQRLRSHNRLLGSFEGADGMKTGFICDSGFNIVASASRDGRRLIAVVLGDASGRERNARAASLLDHGFETADWKTLFGTPVIDKMPIDRSAKPVVSVRTSVVAWNCNGRAPARKVVRKRAKPTAAATAKAGKTVAADDAQGAHPVSTATAKAAQSKAPAPVAASKPAQAKSPTP